MIALASRATMTIRVYDETDRFLGSGSGFVVRDGRIVTNYHVLKGAYRVEVLSESGGLMLTTDYMEAFSEFHDLALLPAIKSSASRIPLASKKPQIGTKVFVIGSPLGLLVNTVSDGIVSGYRSDPAPVLMQLTAPVSPGSSGGPVVNAAGELVGVVVSQLVVGQNLNFAVPVDSLKSLLDQKAASIPIAMARRLQQAPSVSVITGTSPSTPAAPPVAVSSQAQLPRSRDPIPLHEELVPSTTGAETPSIPEGGVKADVFAVSLAGCKQHALAIVYCDVEVAYARHYGASAGLHVLDAQLKQGEAHSQRPAKYSTGGEFQPFGQGASSPICTLNPWERCKFRVLLTGINVLSGEFILQLDVRTGSSGQKRALNLGAYHGSKPAAPIEMAKESPVAAEPAQRSRSELVEHSGAEQEGIALGLYEHLRVLLERCSVEGAASVSCDVRIENSLRAGDKQTLYVDHARIEQFGAASRGPAKLFKGGYYGSMGKACELMPGGKCQVKILFSGMNLVAGEYLLEFVMYEGMFGKSHEVSLEAEFR